jgi:hypothetical protein
LFRRGAIKINIETINHIFGPEIAFPRETFKYPDEQWLRYILSLDNPLIIISKWTEVNKDDNFQFTLEEELLKLI